MLHPHGTAPALRETRLGKTLCWCCHFSSRAHVE